MPLTHVCVWDSKAGYRHISIEEACAMYPDTVAADRGIFVCSLCAQGVGLTAPGDRIRHFRHTSATQKKECDDRSLVYAQSGIGLDCHPMPIRITVTPGNYRLELGFFYASTSLADGPRCRKITITGDSGQKYTNIHRTNLALHIPRPAIQYFAIREFPKSGDSLIFFVLNIFEIKNQYPVLCAAVFTAYSMLFTQHGSTT